MLWTHSTCHVISYINGMRWKSKYLNTHTHDFFVDLIRTIAVTIAIFNFFLFFSLYFVVFWFSLWCDGFSLLFCASVFLGLGFNGGINGFFCFAIFKLDYWCFIFSYFWCVNFDDFFLFNDWGFAAEIRMRNTIWSYKNIRYSSGLIAG